MSIFGPSKEIDPEHPVFGKLCACSDKKEKFQSFCGPCTQELTGHLRSELWKPFSHGYAQDYKKAVEWLRKHSPRFYAN